MELIRVRGEPGKRYDGPIATERVVKEHFEGLGYSVKKMRPNGTNPDSEPGTPDFLVEGLGDRFYVEVKRCCRAGGFVLSENQLRWMEENHDDELVVAYVVDGDFETIYFNVELKERLLRVGKLNYGETLTRLAEEVARRGGYNTVCESHVEAVEKYFKMKASSVKLSAGDFFEQEKKV
jgi:hypothetical protein